MRLAMKPLFAALIAAAWLSTACSRKESDRHPAHRDYVLVDIQESDEPLTELARFQGIHLESRGGSAGRAEHLFPSYRRGGEWLWDSPFAWVLLGQLQPPYLPPPPARLADPRATLKGPATVRSRSPEKSISGEGVPTRARSLHGPRRGDTAPRRRRKRRRRRRRARRPVRFVAISDIHNGDDCVLGLGEHLGKAIQRINSLRPDFVVALGDLVSGGGDCKNSPLGEEAANLETQLDELEEELLDKLKAPFVVVEGNHDFSQEQSDDSSYPREVWEEYWQSQRGLLLKRVRRSRYRRNYRFSFRGVGFAVLGFYGHLGLEKKELQWVKRNIRKGDIVFRHVNLFGVSCCLKGYCGLAIRDDDMEDYEKLFEVLKKKRIRALVSGHTHAFYHGVCGGVRFINSGALGDRSLEFVKGWEDSPYKAKPAFVEVVVAQRRSPQVRFHVYDPEKEAFLPLDPKSFPKRVEVTRMKRLGYEEGVKATCKSVRH